MKLLILAQSAGIDPMKLNYTAFDGGAEAMTTMLGGFVDAFPGDSSEVIGQFEAGKVRVLAALTPNRLEAPFDQVPTAKELGYDAQWVVFRGFYVPKGMSDGAYDWWASTLEKIVESPGWAKVRSQRGLGDFFMAGTEFDAYVKKQVANFTELSQSLNIIK
jgi:putative tricarboxylic transport membrane protein